MISTPVSVLLTRPAYGSARFAQRLESLLEDGVEIVTSPLIGIEPCVTAISLAAYAGVIFTSSNAVRVATECGVPTNSPAYCLGETTTEAARSSGWTAVQCGQDAQSLVADLSSQSPETPLIHLTGVHTRGDVATLLTKSGVKTNALAIYDQPFLPMSGQAKDLLKGGTFVIVPLFSPRSAAQFSETAPFSENAVLIAMSEAVAASVTGSWRSRLSIAAAPTGNAMCAAVELQVNRLSRVEGTDAGQ